MADKGVGHISTSIFPDEIKSALSGNLTFDVAINAEGVHKWVYCTKAITSTAAIFTTANDYFDGVAVADTDIAKYIAIKHSGTSDGSNTTSAGLMLSINGEAAAYNDDDGIFLDQGFGETPPASAGGVNSYVARVQGPVGSLSAYGTAP